MNLAPPVAAQQAGATPDLLRLRAALQAQLDDPRRWLDYIAALIEAGQTEPAGRMLTQAMQRGLQGAAVEALIARLSGGSAPVPASQPGPSTACWNKAVPDAREMDALLDLYAKGCHDEVLQQARNLTTRAPMHGFGWKLLGMALQQHGRLGESLAAKRRAAHLLPVDAEAHSNLGTALDLQGMFDEAEVSLRRALELNPGLAQAHNNLGRVLQSQGRLQEAGRCYRRALELAPDMSGTYSNLLFTISHDADLTPTEVLAAHLEFDRRYGHPLRATWQPHANVKDPAKRLRVGFVSGDLRRHAVAHFLEPIWREFDRAQIEIVAYSTATREDSKTLDLRALTGRWVNVAAHTDAQLADLVRADGVDILVDLSGHTKHNRLLVFARKPAPVQVSGIGYPHTSGLSAIDYRISDDFRLPPALEAQYVEKVVRIPCSGPFEHGPAPAVNSLPALTAGVFTFGSFQRATKINETTLRLWSRVLLALPGSRMLIGATGDAGSQERIRAGFAANGVAPHRLVFHPRMQVQDYLALHHQVDLLLDSHPYPGGTTTNHGLWMGVPTLTRVGESVVSWQGAGTLLRLGLTEMVARDDDEYVRLAQRWAGDLATLANLRATLRQHVDDSPLRKPKAVAAGYQAAYRAMWERWCHDRPVEAFTVTL